MTTARDPLYSIQHTSIVMAISRSGVNGLVQRGTLQPAIKWPARFRRSVVRAALERANTPCHWCGRWIWRTSTNAGFCTVGCREAFEAGAPPERAPYPFIRIRGVDRATEESDGD